jgi:Tol biopolymer transport system component/DNA-binding winged helix-turn-helix (wHTH) protein
MSDPVPVTARIVRFSVFELDLRAGELRKAGRRLNLPDQPFQLLAALLERPGDIVTRDELQQRLWRSDTFVDFDRGLNAAIKRLRDVLGDSADTPRFVETVPRRGYRFLGSVGPEAQPASAESVADPVPLPPPVAEPRRWQWWWFAAAGAFGSAITLLVWSIPRVSLVPTAVAPLRAVQVTSMRGMELDASFSPDGTAIVFTHGDNGGLPNSNVGIYAMTIGASEPRRLSPDHRADGVVDHSPSWSPDGQQIAFLRGPPTWVPSSIHVMSPFGSGSTKISDFPVHDNITWSPDSAFIVASREAASPLDTDGGIYLIPVRGGAPRRVTHARFPAKDSFPVLSRDGRQLAYAQCSANDCEIRVLDMTGAMAPAGPPRRVSKVLGADRISWMRDGRSLVYGTLVSFIPYIWRVETDGRQAPQRLDVPGLGAWRPSVSLVGNRLIYSKGLTNLTVRRFEAGLPSAPVLESSVMDFEASFSPDGLSIAFTSTRSGEQAEIWIADADGRHARQLLHGPGVTQGHPQWSPDGRTLAFDSVGTDGRSHVWTVDSSGGTPRQLTTGDGEHLPTWSRDGSYIYYSTGVDSGTHAALWRTSVKAGVPLRVTERSGGLAYELEGGAELVYQTVNGDGPLVVGRIGARPSRQIAACVQVKAFAAVPSGIFYVACGSTAVLHHVDRNGSRDRVVGTLDGYSSWWLGVSADGKSVLYGHGDRPAEVDLYLVERFD